jgi:hypothetical protein
LSDLKSTVEIYYNDKQCKNLWWVSDVYNLDIMYTIYISTSEDIIKVFVIGFISYHV